jgi:hypothetical protein
VDAEREVIDVSLLSTEVEDADLRVGYTTVEAGLRIRLFQIRQLKPKYTAPD